METNDAAAGLRAAVMVALASVDDPEMGENLVDLGVVGEVEVDDGRVRVSLIPTSATCPMADLMVEDARRAVQQACPIGTEVDVYIDWDTKWSPERLAPALRECFGW